MKILMDELDMSLDEAVRLVEKPVRTFGASLKSEMPDAWQLAERTDDIETAYRALSPMVLKMAEEVKCGGYEEAAGNLLALFGTLASIKSRHEEWFENMLHGGNASNMVYLADVATTVYCHLRQHEGLSEDLAEDMDVRLVLLNGRTGLFGDWTVNMYADMLLTAECQSEDYSDLEQCEIWKGFGE